MLNGDTAHSSVDEFAFAGVESGSNLEAQFLDGGRDSARAAAQPTGPRLLVAVATPHSCLATAGRGGHGGGERRRAVSRSRSRDEQGQAVSTKAGLSVALA
jgi:hypothetical protein